jgi:hypothetical protein
MVGVLGTQTRARPIVEPQPLSSLLFLWRLQPLTTPGPLVPVLIHLRACSSDTAMIQRYL